MPIRRTIALVGSALLVSFISAAGLAGCATKKGTTYALYFLGGQSNMEGFGYVSELGPEWGEPPTDLYIFQPNLTNDEQPSDPASRWVPVTPGFGTGYAVRNGEPLPGGRFGLELSFAHRMRELDPKTPIAILKYGKGGSSIDLRVRGGAGSWDTVYEGLNQYDHAMAAFEAATTERDVDGDGETDRFEPAGIVWMQGETDATNEQTARMYKVNLLMLISSLRLEMGQPDLPVVIGRISDSRVQSGEGRVWAFGDTVRALQAEFVAEDKHAALITSTDEYGYSDPYHYDTAGYLDFGEKVAEAMHQLQMD